MPARGRPLLPFPALTPPCGAPFIRRCALLRSSFPALAALHSLQSLQPRPAPLPTAPIPTPPPTPKTHPHGQPPAPPPCRARPEKSPLAARHHPLIRQQATGQKACHPPAKLAFQPRRQKQGPLRGGFHWGVPQTPAIMPRPKRPGHPPRPPQPKSRSTLKRPAPPSNSWGQPQTPQ